MYQKPILFILLVLFSAKTFPYFETQNTNDPAVMNDIKMSDYLDFTEKWHLVTVRYREDSNEMRFTYANNKAWKEMKSLKPNFSDGAVFAKVGLIAEKDPAFISSLVPSGAKRYQFMVRDKKKYKDTQGWGYALFNESGKLFNEDMKLKTNACVACHAIVPERDFVFSRPMKLSFGSSTTQLIKSNQLEKYVHFVSKKISDLPKIIGKKLGNATKSVDMAEGDVKTNSFSGTLDEIIPFLIENSKTSGRTSVLYIDDKNFTLVEPDGNKKSCLPKISYHIEIYFNNSKVRSSELCK